MLTIRAGATALAFVLATSFAVAQTPTPPAKPAPTGAMKQDQMKSDQLKSSATTSSTKSSTDEVKNWSEKKWNSMKAEWQKDKAKWNACDQKSKDQKLTGKASWSFFYDCMKA